jgi:drug/metabolite transporter (DMT)-like permease
VRSAVVALALAILALSTAAPLIRGAAPAPALTVAALRIAIAALALAAIAGRDLAALRRLSWRERGLVVVAGLVLAAHFATWIASIYLTTVAASVALVAINPVFAALLGGLLGDRVRGREWIGIAIAVAGSLVLAGGDWQAGGKALLGDGLAVIGAGFGAGYLIVGRRLRTALPLWPYLAAVNAVAALALLAAALVHGDALVGWPPGSYAAIAGGALVASVGGHTLLNVAVRRAPAHLAALAILGEPIGASLITWAYFGEQPGRAAAIGGAVILAGIAIGFLSPRRPAAR